VGDKRYPVLYCVHPAAILRGGEENKRIFQKVMDRLLEIKEDKND